MLPLSLLIYLFYVDLNLTRVIDIHAAGFIHNCTDSPLLSQEVVKGLPIVENNIC